MGGGSDDHLGVVCGRVRRAQIDGLVAGPTTGPPESEVAVPVPVLKTRIERVDQSPVNPKRWSLTLLCGHGEWVTSIRRPKVGTQRVCGVCHRARGETTVLVDSSAAELRTLTETSYTTTQAAELLGLSDSLLRNRLKGRAKLYGFRHGNSWLIPKFQIEAHPHAHGYLRILPGLAPVVSRLNPSLNPVTVARWFHTPNSDLVDGSDIPMSPIDWLRGGGSPEVAAELAATL